MMQLYSASWFAFDSGVTSNICHFLEWYQELNIFGSIKNVFLLKSDPRETMLLFLCVFLFYICMLYSKNWHCTVRIWHWSQRSEIHFAYEKWRNVCGRRFNVCPLSSWKEAYIMLNDNVEEDWNITQGEFNDLED